MKKLLILPVLAFGLVGCGNLDMFDTNYTYHCAIRNLDMFDTNYTYHYAITRWPDGTMKKIEIEQWSDYEGEQIQIISTDGNIYLLSMNSTVLVRDSNK